MAINIVNIGVILFNMPASPEDIPVSAYVNRKAGARLPKIATIKKELKSFLKSIDLNACIAKGSSTILAIRIRIVATWLEENVSYPSAVYIAFFISMNELPQIIESKISRVQYFSEIFTVQKYVNTLSLILFINK
tara:strand:+ start:20056 stop:20460 length:405 start_codon:yes stop_codon:yes gene_type:complete